MAKFIYTKDQIQLLTKLFQGNNKSIAATLTVAYSCGDTFASYKSVGGAIELVRFAEKIARIVNGERNVWCCSSEESAPESWVLEVTVS